MVRRSHILALVAEQLHSTRLNVRVVNFGNAFDKDCGALVAIDRRRWKLSDKMLVTNLLGRTVRKGINRGDLWFVRQEGDVLIDRATTATIVAVASSESTDTLSLWAQADDGEAKGEVKHFRDWAVVVEVAE